MATGIEMYRAIQRAAGALNPGQPLKINRADCNDLLKLYPSDLEKEGLDEKRATEITTALVSGDFGPLQRHLGFSLDIDPFAPAIPADS